MASPYQFHRIESGATGLPPLLFLHGFLGSATDWAEPGGLFERLNDRFRCIAFDLPGHGRTIVDGADDCYRMENVAHGLCEAIRKVADDRCSVVAYSMGGRLALYMAVKYPHLFDRVILESTSPGLETAADRHRRARDDEILAERIGHEPLKKFLDFWYGQPFFATIKRDSSRFQMLMKRRMDNYRDELSHALKGLSTGAQPSLWGKLPDIENRCLLIAGREDAKFVAIAEAMVARGLKAEVTVFEDCGHNVHYEKPERFAREVRRFLGVDTQDKTDDN